jgi:hypothetical protein
MGNACFVKFRSRCRHGRVGDPGRDLAPVIELLGTDEAHFLTAGTLVTDGGLWMGL